MSEHNRPLAVALNGYGLTRPEGPEVLPLEDVVHAVHAAERGGYEAVFVPEIAAREAFSTLTALARTTERVRLATGVVRLDRRDLRTTALAAATVDEVSGGRLILGVGSRGPIDATRTFVTDLRRLLAGRTVDTAHGQDRLDRAPETRVPIYLAALGPRMCELAGEVADGVVLNWCTPQRVSGAREQIAAGARRSGRDPAAVRIAVYVRCSVEPEAHALAALREAASGYAAMPTYRRQFEAMGLGAEADAAARGPDRVPEPLLRAVCAWGGPDQVTERLEDYRRAGAGLVVVYPVPVLEAASSILATVLGVAPRPAAAA